MKTPFGCEIQDHNLLLAIVSQLQMVTSVSCIRQIFVYNPADKIMSSISVVCSSGTVYLLIS